jgi:hypothetical protein
MGLDVRAANIYILKLGLPIILKGKSITRSID